MYICNSCGKKFISPIVHRKNIGFAEQPYYEDEAKCPHCGTCFDFEEYKGVLTPEEEELAYAMQEQKEWQDMYDYYCGR